MALSGRVVVRATTQNNLIFSWAAVQSAAENASTVSWQLLLEAKQYGRIVATPGSPWSVTVDGKNFSGTTSLAIGNNETKVLASGSVTLDHAADGTRSFSFSFSQEFWITFDGESIPVVSGSGSAALDTIARASTPTLSAASVELGKAVTIYTNPASSFTHTLEYSFGNASGVVAQGVGDFCQWTPSIELARQIPNGASGTAVIKCTTYAGSAPIGSKQVTVVLTVPEAVVPTASAQWTDLSGAYGKMNCLVQHISRLQVDVSAAGAYGSTPVSSAVTLGGKAYGGGYLTDSGELSLKVSVTDSRGRTGYDEDSITVAPYTPPQLTLSASRCTSDGTADEAGTCAKITVSGHVTQVNGRNTAELKVTWAGGAETVNPAVGDIFWQKIVAADPDATMAISAVLSDQLASTPRDMTLSTGYATLDLLAGGRGIAFGKAATREGFDCAMPAYFTGGVSGIAAADVGAVPAEIPWLANRSVLEWATSLRHSGWAGVDPSTLDLPPNPNTSNHAIVTANVGIVGYWIELRVNYVLTGCVAVRIYNYGWGEWEWENPPMAIGVEYRTTERHNGKPVFAKAVELNLAGSGFKSVYVTTGISEIVSMVGTYYQGWGVLAENTVGVSAVQFNLSSGYLQINSADLSGTTAKYIVKYTK